MNFTWPLSWRCGLNGDRFVINCVIVATLILLLTLGVNRVQAGAIYVPNGSFESPSTDFVDTQIDSWQELPKPSWYDESAYGPWNQLFGVFLNTPPDSQNNDHIVNCDGAQAAFLFAMPGAALFQDLPAVYQPGRNYSLTVDVMGNGGGMSNGTPLTISFYYRDASSNAVTIATTTVTNSAVLFPDRNHLVSFTASVPAVTVSNAWAGKNIGVQIASTVDFTLGGGYWDVDNVRVSESIAVPNYSFEKPATTFVDTEIQSWEKSPMPDWYDPTAYGSWDQLSGVFLNTPADSPNNDHIGDCDQSQAAFVFAMPGVLLVQDNLTSTNAFDVKFQPGNSYQLTVGVLGNGGGMSNGVTLLIGLYYVDSASNAITIASTTVTNSNDLFPNRTNMVDFSALLPPVKTTDAWAGKNLGIEIMSTVDFSLAGGYWDVDNVRLVSFRTPVLSVALATNGLVNLALQSEPGSKFEVLASTKLVSDWTSIATVTNTTGSTTLTDTMSGAQQRFYRARQLP